ncbi:hypothetical protein V2G26_005356 [Clonostachys chloroleuca]
MANLSHIDFTNLKYFRFLHLEAPKLQEFKIDELKGFIRNYTGPIATANEARLPGITIQNIPNVKQLTLGWKSILSAHISGQLKYRYWSPPPNITLIIGCPDSETVYISELETREGIIGIERGSKITSLSIGSFKSMNDMITDLRLPFDQVSNVSIRGDRMTSLELPKVEQCEHLNCAGA